MNLSKWKEVSIGTNKYHESVVRLFDGFDPIFIVRIHEHGPIIIRGFLNGAPDHMIASYGMAHPNRLTVEEQKVKAMELISETILKHLQDK